MSEMSDLPKDFLKEGHRIQKSASGDSMLPSIPDGAILQIKPLQQNSVRLGDIVYFFENDGNTKIHRVSCIVKRGHNTFIQTWGDNCDKPDSVIKSSQILGRVTAYRGEDEWYQMDFRVVVYAKYFLKKYCWYYLRKIPGRLLNVLNQHK